MFWRLCLCSACIIAGTDSDHVCFGSTVPILPTPATAIMKTCMTIYFFNIGHACPVQRSYKFFFLFCFAFPCALAHFITILRWSHLLLFWIFLFWQSAMFILRGRARPPHALRGPNPTYTSIRFQARDAHFCTCSLCHVWNRESPGGLTRFLRFIMGGFTGLGAHVSALEEGIRVAAADLPAALRLSEMKAICGLGRETVWWERLKGPSWVS